MFEPHQMPVLLDPAQWRLVTSGSRGGARASASMRQWYATHRHRHAHREVLICLSGRDQYGLADSLHAAVPGTVMIFGPMEPHQGGYPPFAQPLDHLWISFLPDRLLARVVKVRQGSWAVQSATWLPYEGNDVGFHIAERAWGNPAGEALPEAVRRVRLMATVASVVAPLLERGFRPAHAVSERLSDSQRIIASLMEHLTETGGKDDSLSSLARIAGYSPYHFLRLFKRVTGYTVHGYIDLCRWQRVNDLRARNWSEKAIGTELGFSTPQSYCRWCRQARGGDDGLLAVRSRPGSGSPGDSGRPLRPDRDVASMGKRGGPADASPDWRAVRLRDGRGDERARPALDSDRRGAPRPDGPLRDRGGHDLRPTRSGERLL
jgi:AraC-like DNA-binding protein